MLNRISRDLNEIIVGCEEQQIIYSEECSDLDITSAAMVFNNGYVVMMDNSMMDNTIQVTIQPSTGKYSIYYYFSSTFEVSIFIVSYFFSCIKVASYMHLNS